MKIPEDFELLSLFGVEPAFADEITQVPYFYNRSTYSFFNSVKQHFTVSISPSHGEMRISVDNKGERISFLSFRNIQSIEILEDNEREARIMISKERTIIKLNFKPQFMISYEEEIQP